MPQLCKVACVLWILCGVAPQVRSNMQSFYLFGNLGVYHAVSMIGRDSTDTKYQNFPYRFIHLFIFTFQVLSMIHLVKHLFVFQLFSNMQKCFLFQLIKLSAGS